MLVCILSALVTAFQNSKFHIKVYNITCIVDFVHGGDINFQKRINTRKVTYMFCKPIIPMYDLRL